MRNKLEPIHYEILRRIHAAGGSYCPSRDIDPDLVRALHDLVRAKRLSVEANDGAPPRYTLTAQGEADAA